MKLSIALGLLLLTAAVATFWTPYPVWEQAVGPTYQGPSAAHPLGLEADAIRLDVLADDDARQQLPGRGVGRAVRDPLRLDLEDRDLVYFDKMLEWLRANHCFHPERVFLMGYSNGAGLVGVSHSSPSRAACRRCARSS